MSTPRFHPEARLELLEAILVHEEARVGYGAKLADEVERVLAQVVEFPGTGAALAGYPDELDARAFQLSTFRYRLIVLTVNREPVVYAVAHTSRRPGYWRDRVSE